MKASLKWLKEYLDVSLPAADLADRLTMAGSEVKAMQVIGSQWENIVVGQIIAINPHPNADRLTLPTVNLGTEQATVVCGAPNLKVGDKIAFARVGAQLRDGHTGQVEHLKPAKIRGVVSSGMVCSEKELGISDNHEGIMILPPEAPVGIPLADYIGDVIFDLDVTPNRPDCLSVIGIARELAALTGGTLHLPEISYMEGTSSIEQQIAVQIDAPDLCPRYCASLIRGVKLAESPDWMKQRLLACGMRPINNIVDVTNYVMLEYGQPLHAFDYSQIRGKKIIVRRANNGEHIISLDGAERALSPDMLVIADSERPVAVAGIMGGANSEVIEQTTSILLEAASFKPASVYYTGKTLCMPSEACMRFERGIRSELAFPALKRATQLILELAGGEADRGVIDVYPGKVAPQPMLLSVAKVKQVLGIEFSLEQIVKALVSLGFDCKESGSGSEVMVTAPYWRSDINQTVDLVEEVARVVGYDKIPMTLLGQEIPRQSPDPVLTLKREAGQILTGYGFQEAITFSLTGLDMMSKLLPETHSPASTTLRVLNPMTAELEYLRPDLRANLLPIFAANRRHEDGGIRLFELGKVYLPQPNNLPDEPEVVCGIMGGRRLAESWQCGDELMDFFDAKGVAESLLGQLGVAASFEECSDESLYPDERAAIIVGGNKVGVVGKLHPQVLEAFEISEALYLFEMNLTSLLPFTIGHKMYQPIPRFPSVVRDMALVVDAKVIHQAILNVMKSFPLVSQVAIFDVYSGEQVPPGKKSLAYRITFQSSSHTLTDDEVNQVQQQILSKLSNELGAVLRT